MGDLIDIYIHLKGMFAIDCHLDQIALYQEFNHRYQMNLLLETSSSDNQSYITTMPLLEVQRAPRTF